LKVGIESKSYIKFNGSNGSVGINTSTIENVALSVNGSATFKNNVAINSNSSSTVGLSLTGSALVSGHAAITGNLNVTGVTTLTGMLTVSKDIIPSTLIQSLGSQDYPFENIYVANIGNSSTYVRIFGSVTTATTLESSRTFKIAGHTTSTAVAFNGTGNVTFITTATRELIKSPVGGSTTSTTATQTLLVLNTASNSSELQSISKKSFLSDVYPGLIQTGMIVPAGTSATIYTGFVLCDGKAYQQGDSTTTNLFSVISTTYGTGSAGTFRVPNLLSSTTSIYYHIKL
jgi:hypothetical protein